MNGVSQADGDSDRALAWVRTLGAGRAWQRNNGFCQHLYLGERGPFSPHLNARQVFHLCPWQLLSYCPSARGQSRWVRQRVRPCEGPLRGMPGTPTAHLVTWSQSPLVDFHSQSNGTSLPATGTLSWGAWCKTRTPQWNLCSQDNPPDFQLSQKCVKSACFPSPPLLLVST